MQHRWTVEELARVRQGAEGVIKAIDAGTLSPTEQEMVALATLCDDHPLLKDLVVQLAARCKNGRTALKRHAS